MKGKALIRYYIQNPSKLFFRVGRGTFLRLLSDEQYLKLLFKSNLGYTPDFNNPKTFNEKLNWLKLHDRKPIYTTMVDKYEAKKYVASIIGDEYIIPTLGVWDRFEDIDFDALPDQFVLKCTHDSGGLVIVKDKSKLDKEAARKKINRSLRTNYYLLGREWPYKNVKPRIIAEKYMTDSGKGLRDYKFFSFDGEPKFMYISEGMDNHQTAKVSFFTLDGQLLPFHRLDYAPFKENVGLPDGYSQMLETCRVLTEKIGSAFVRMDLYCIEGKTYFSEITFSPCGGFVPFEPTEWDTKLGEMIRLPEIRGGGYSVVGNSFIIWLHAAERVKTEQLTDYKFYTMNGTVKVMMIVTDRGIATKADYFDRDYNHLDFTWGYPNSSVFPAKPSNYEKMIDLAEKLAIGTTEVRVDFYESGGRLYFGELTFFDGSGLQPFLPVEWDKRLGDWLELPKAQMENRQ